jgi:formate/nitrite transporter FocA (FNT family)
VIVNTSVLMLEEICEPSSLCIAVQLTDSHLLIVISNTAAMGMMLGADISVTRLFFQALLPATLGNMAGGGIIFAAVYWFCFDSKNIEIDNLVFKKKEVKSDVESENSKSDVDVEA